MERSLGGKTDCCQQSGTEPRRINGLLPTIWNGASAGKRTASCNHFYLASTIPCWPARIWRRSMPRSQSAGADNLERSLGNIMAGKRNCNHYYQAQHYSVLAYANIESAPFQNAPAGWIGAFSEMFFGGIVNHQGTASLFHISPVRDLLDMPFRSSLRSRLLRMDSRLS
jgi:hypothetical protein